jgi:hypothetical protein
MRLNSFGTSATIDPIASPVTGRGGLGGCLDSRLTDGGNDVSLTHRPRSTP